MKRYIKTSSDSYKTFYTVRYSKLGADKPQMAYFDNKQDAENFYNDGDYRDKPQAHNVSNEKTIKQYNDLVEQTAYELNY